MKKWVKIFKIYGGVKTKRYKRWGKSRGIVCMVLIAYLLFSCKGGEISNEIIDLSSGDKTGITNSDGEVLIKNSTLTDGGIKIIVQNESGQRVEGIEVSYEEKGDHAFLSIHDPKKRYLDYVASGTLSELSAKTNQSSISPQAVPVVVVVIVVISVAIAAYEIGSGFYKMANFVIDPKSWVAADVSIVNGTYIEACKTPEEIVEFIIGSFKTAKGIISLALLPYNFVNTAEKATTYGAAKVIGDEVFNHGVKKAVGALLKFALDAGFSMVENMKYPVIMALKPNIYPGFSFVFEIQLPSAQPLVDIKDKNYKSIEDGQTISGTQENYITACDSSGLENITFKIGDNIIETITTFYPERSFPYQIIWNSANYSDGTYQLKAVVRDGGGQENEDSVSVILNNGVGAICGNGVCESGETETNCPQDCGGGGGAICGNGVCESGETETSCPEDCGPVLWLKFDECSGSTAYDSSGKGNNGTINGATWVNLGGENCVLSFDGVDDYVEIPDSSSFDSAKMTIEAWFNVSSCPSGEATDIVSKHSASWNVQMLFRLEADCKLDIEWTIGDKFYDLSYGSCPPTNSYCDDEVGIYNVTLNTWYHGVAVYDGNEIILYVNGQKIKSIEASGEIVKNSLPTVIGGFAFNPSADSYAGMVDEVRIYPTALSGDTILEHYQNEKGRYP